MSQYIYLSSVAVPNVEPCSTFPVSPTRFVRCRYGCCCGSCKEPRKGLVSVPSPPVKATRKQEPFFRLDTLIACDGLNGIPPHKNYTILFAYCQGCLCQKDASRNVCVFQFSGDFCPNVEILPCDKLVAPFRHSGTSDFQFSIYLFDVAFLP